MIINISHILSNCPLIIFRTECSLIICCPLLFTCLGATQVYNSLFSFALSPSPCNPLSIRDTITTYPKFAHFFFFFWDQLLPVLTSCCQMWPTVFRCDQMVKVVTTLSKFWPAGSICDQLLPGVTSCFQVWLTVAGCDQLVSAVTRWSKLWPGG